MTYDRKLPVGIHDFEKLRRDGFLYVDKTRYVYDLAMKGAPCFLGRPQRFGKSLFLSTLKAYFLGKRELFAGLEIDQVEKEWVEYPVFYVDMSIGIITDNDSLVNRLKALVDGFEKQWGRTVEDNDPATRFAAVIRWAYEQTGRKVVVLVDDYEKPLPGNMDDPIVSEAIRKTLKGFYGVLKSVDACLRFVFLTGVGRFPEAGVFSDLNQLQDISMEEAYAGICGLSERELLRDFGPELRELAKKRKLTYEAVVAGMKKRYDGYHFAQASEGIYNPFSVLNTFAAGYFADYWFQTGTPTSLVNMLKGGDFELPNLDNNVRTSVRGLSDYRVEWGNPIPVLYQSGYLTIKEYDAEFNEFVLGFPNEEVKYGFLWELMPAYAPMYAIRQDFSASQFIRLLRAGDVEKFVGSLQAFLTAIPYDPEEEAERHFRLVFYLLAAMMGQFAPVEVKIARGRADAVIQTADTVYVLEFKVTGSGTAEDAWKQINNPAYPIPYTAKGRRIVKVGAEFNAQERVLVRWWSGEGKRKGIT
ncbi:MAG: ATP-binding protein [Tannerellaceae bacterium]|jgi:hypothetical protein|nr:ATP-binding protein [Tannerellaceae bacterium]